MPAKPERVRDREHELEDAICAADLPARDYRIYRTLLRRVDWKVAVIPDRFQPRSLKELAAWARTSKANLALGLNHLERHGWIERYRNISDRGIGGRGRGTRYGLQVGRDCDCAKGSDPEPDKGSEAKTVPLGEGSKNPYVKGPEDLNVSAGQGHVSAEEGRDEGELEEGPSLTACRVCLTPMDPVLPRLGYTTHPCCDPDDKGDLGRASKVTTQAAPQPAVRAQRACNPPPDPGRDAARNKALIDAGETFAGRKTSDCRR